jgi:hypothetical protein
MMKETMQPNYMFVDSHVHKRTYTRTLRIHYPTSPSLPDVEAAITRPGGAGTAGRKKADLLLLYRLEAFEHCRDYRIL